MAIESPWDFERVLGSHQAVLSGIINVLNPKSGIECGGGDHSTPLLRASLDCLITIEHNVKWWEELKEKYPENTNHEWIFRPFWGITDHTRLCDISDEDKRIVEACYKELGGFLPPCDLMLDDTHLCARLPAIRYLHPKVRMIIVHDMCPQFRTWYGYQYIKDILTGWYCYMHKPVGKIGGTHPIPWTGLYSRDPLPVDEMDVFVKEESMRLWEQPVGLVQEA